MINTLYVAGSKSNFPGLEEQNINLDYVQNGMIALVLSNQAILIP